MKIAVNTRLLIHDKLDGIGWFSFETLNELQEITLSMNSISYSTEDTMIHLFSRIILLRLLQGLNQDILFCGMYGLSIH
jgi:hypothetical protein